ncbi:hypothetical protein TPY_1152 [Sulfobacillus acidophilus TPY]|uniref:XapX domain protein n=1 Tax=Sulfobacillus acidophilus (strain ATCC 700253 / DSM 10332 / NAL) TaxID=679936 RepID=G8TW33_SULAD|nr:hypothetical protein TPY_1152 [Sulfobacillus acidophilus TPY]AEW05960.1 XapX domain protein [Sulfobacillus acidophilus DSM 10332]
MGMREAIWALLAGFILGALFRWLKLPVPAPSSWGGILGIIGVFLGFSLMQYWLK